MRCLHMNRVLALVGVAGGWLALSGCLSVGPDYQRPEVDVPAQWQGNATDAVEGEAKTPSVALESWWTIFQDPALEALMAKTRQANLSLAAAWATMESYAAQLNMERSAFVPSMGANGEAVWDRQTEVVHARTEYPDNPAWLYQAGFSLQWELDVWGRVRRSVEAARGLLDASLEDWRDALVSLQAETASQYIQLRTLQQQVAFAEQNLALQEASVRLTKGRFDAGLTGELDVHQAEMNLAATRAQLPQLQADLASTLNALCLLTAQLPGALDDLLTPAPVPEPGELPALLPAEVLRQRPDIRAAERRLAAQTAKIGVARADFFPKLSLNGSFALATTYSGDFFKEAAQNFSIGPGLDWSIFTAGKVRNHVKAEEAATRAALANYRQTVLSAYGECESAMTTFRCTVQARAELERAVQSAQKSVELADTLYRNGLTDFQNVLDMQQQLFNYQDAYAQSMGSSASRLVAVYKAVGGGWASEAATVDSKPATVVEAQSAGDVSEKATAEEKPAVEEAPAGESATPPPEI